MSHPIHRVTWFAIIGPYALAVEFSDGIGQRIGFQPILHGTIFGPLCDLSTFNAVSLDGEAGTIVWPNGADFDPATLNDWPTAVMNSRPGLAGGLRLLLLNSSGLTPSNEWSRRAVETRRRAAHS